MTLYRGLTKREYLALKMFEAGCDTDVADGTLTASDERVAELWIEYVGNECPICAGTREVHTPMGLGESPADALVSCPWCSGKDTEPVEDPVPF